MPVNHTSTGQAALVSGIKINVFAKDGDGKTTLIPTAPRPFIGDIDKKTVSIAKHNIPGAVINTWEDALDVVAWFKSSTEARSYDTFCPDSFSTLCEILFAEEKKRSVTSSGKPDMRRVYPEYRDKLATMLRDLMSIPDKNILFISKAVLTEQPDSTKLYTPATPGASSESGIGYYVNENFCLRIANVNTANEYRYLQTRQDEYAQSRDNSNALLPKEKPDITYIIEKIRAGLKDVVAPQQKSAPPALPKLP